MFGKLKEAFKKGLSLFQKKADESAESAVAQEPVSQEIKTPSLKESEPAVQETVAESGTKETFTSSKTTIIPLANERSKDLSKQTRGNNPTTSPEHSQEIIVATTPVTTPQQLSVKNTKAKAPATHKKELSLPSEESFNTSSKSETSEPVIETPQKLSSLQRPAEPPVEVPAEVKRSTNERIKKEIKTETKKETNRETKEEVKVEAKTKLKVKTEAEANTDFPTSEKTISEQIIINSQNKSHEETNLNVIFQTKTPLSEISQPKEPASQVQLGHEQTKTSAPGVPTKSLLQKAKAFFTTKTITAAEFDELFWELELSLLELNVAVEVIEIMKHDLQQLLVDKPLPRNVASVIRDSLQMSIHKVLSFTLPDLTALMQHKKPFVILFLGINGSGKTTTLAKVARMFQKQGKTVVIAAADTFRAAAIDQLEYHAQKLEIPVIKHAYGADAAAVGFDAVQYAQKHGTDVVLIDTAGRLHSNINLMDELHKIVRVTKPDFKLFVGESITGNDCIEQAEQFGSIVGFDAMILTKADVDEKGGTAISLSYKTGKPILFLGKGQSYDDLEVFEKDKLIAQIFG